MRAFDEDALICDFAETYHILDYRALPVKLQATLACGLRESSRIRMKMSGDKLSLDNVLRAAMLDELAFLAYAKTEDAQKGINRPKSVLMRLAGEEPAKELQSFASGEDFEAKRRKIMER